MGNLWTTQDDAGTCGNDRVPVEVLIAECSHIVLSASHELIEVV